VLNQVADGVWVRQSEWVLSNAIAVRGEGGLILVDPGIDGSDLNQLADDLDRLGIPVVAGFSAHPHWDHLLWHPRLGHVPRYKLRREEMQGVGRGQRLAAADRRGALRTGEHQLRRNPRAVASHEQVRSVVASKARRLVCRRPCAAVRPARSARRLNGRSLLGGLTARRAWRRLGAVSGPRRSCGAARGDRD
jgi:hypothetical protein